jgi:hypothetical protein
MKKLVNLNNPYRVVLTEVLPYETPFLFSNRNFYENLQGDGTAKWLKDYFYPGKDAPSRPFEYRIHRKGGKKSRSLCVIHPYAQVKVADFYQKYGNYLLYLNCLSPFSLRHISSERKSIFVDDPDINKFQDYDSYFEYLDYNREYKFFESSRFLRLEQKYQFMRVLDIEKCFYHIYTHTFAWAVKGKDAIKDSLGVKEDPCTCEAEFDELMMGLNYKETNGIVVGPEFSRIFAEIILQRVDLNVLSRLKTEKNLVFGRHYEVKRYVDDYFVFSFDEGILDEVESIIDDELVPYKLFLNDSKKETFRRPFPNHIVSAKADLSSLYDRYSEKWKRGETYTNLDREDFQSYANRIREVAATRLVEFESLVRYQLSLFTSTLDTISKSISEGKTLNVDVILNIVEISLYVYSLDMNPSTSYKICKIIQSAHEISKMDKEAMIEVEQLLRLELKRILSICVNEYDVTETNIEVINILLLMEREGIMDMDRDFIIDLFPHTQKRMFDWNQLNYFHICTLLFLFGNKTQFINDKKELHKHLLGLFSELKGKNLAQSELMLLLLDYVACPFVDNKEKNSLLVKALGRQPKHASVIRNKITSYGVWFFDWTGNVSTRDYLYMKEAHSPY